MATKTLHGGLSAISAKLPNQRALDPLLSHLQVSHSGPVSVAEAGCLNLPAPLITFRHSHAEVIGCGWGCLSFPDFFFWSVEFEVKVRHVVLFQQV